MIQDFELRVCLPAVLQLQLVALDSPKAPDLGGAFLKQDAEALSREQSLMPTTTQRPDAEIRLAGACRDAEGASNDSRFRGIRPTEGSPEGRRESR